MEPVVARLTNPVRDYAWGSREVLARLQGRAVPSERPEAELWLGAHASDASTWMVDGAPRPLDLAIAEDPDRLLGPDVHRRFGPQLPFLLKVLAVARPLSLQVHPTEHQARTGFAREEELGIPVGSPGRNYTDPAPKPELIRALTRFHAFCGFRAVDATLELLERLAIPSLSWVADQLQDGGEAVLADVVARLLRTPATERGALVRAIGDACSRGAWDTFAGEARWLAELAQRYPGDPGVAVASLLELIELPPGGSLHVPAGTLHSYLSGTGVEIMASSDNVLRGGLTDKHIDVAELLHVLWAGPRHSVRVDPVDVGDERVHPAPARYFRLSEPQLGGAPITLDQRGGQILFCIDGEVAVTADGTRIPLGGADSVFVAGAASQVQVEGNGTVFRATVGDDDQSSSP